MNRLNSALPELLALQGFGTRQMCRMAVERGEVSIRYSADDEIPWTIITDPDHRPEIEGLFLCYGKWTLPCLQNLHLIFFKPGNVECSRQPTNHKSVLDFFPEPFIRRGLQPVGRLDADATGLLLLSDEGNFNHAVTSPRRRLPKTYRIGMESPLTDEQKLTLETGVLLHDDPKRTVPCQVEIVSNMAADITITEGRYHQVKRMLAAVGNRVASIHRSAIGDLTLGNLSAGEWRYLTPEEVQVLITRPAKVITNSRTL